MTPQPGKKSLVSEIIFVGALIILLIILGACALFIYNSIMPDPSPTPVPAPTTTATPVPSPVPTPTPRASPSATPKPSLDSSFYQQDTRITAGDYVFTCPGIWDKYIVYDMFDGGTNSTWLYNVATGDRTQIANGVVFSYGNIGNGKVMLFYPNNGNRIYLYDINSRESALTCTDDNSIRNSITMFGTNLAYYQDVGHYDNTGKWTPNYHIYVFDMIQGSAADVMDNLPKPLDLRIYGQKLVYTVASGPGKDDIYLLDLAAKNPSPQKINEGPGLNNNARIYDHYIVYHSDTDGTDHIYIYDINTGNTIEPAKDSAQGYGDIYGTTVVYDDNRNGNWDIYTYDLNTHNERRLTNEPHDQQAPVIYGNRIAYMDNRDGDWQIYTMTIS